MKKIFFALLATSFFALNANDLGEIAKKYWGGWRKGTPVPRYRKLTQEQIKVKREGYLKAVKKYAPHWLDDFAAVDKAMGWKPGTYLEIVLFGMDYTKIPPLHECTSWVVMPDMTDGKTIMVHKNRDTYQHQITGIRRAVPGKYSWIGMGNYGAIGVNSGINSKGLTVAMNSADESKDRNYTGFGTPQVARILLEECADAESAIKLLGRIIDDKMYLRGSAGSIWFIADSKKAFVVENNAKYYFAIPITKGVGIRSNIWQSAEMMKHSTREISEVIKHTRREYEIRRVLLHEVHHQGKKITPADIAHVSRIDVPGVPKTSYPICGHQTVSGSTFIIDQEFPEDLSYCSFVYGPTRHSFYLPIPITLKDLPDEIQNGALNHRAHKRFVKGAWKKEAELQAVEAKLFATHTEAIAKARAVLKAGGKDAKIKAAAILKDAFDKNWKALLAAEKVDSRNWFEKLFDL